MTYPPSVTSSEFKIPHDDSRKRTIILLLYTSSSVNVLPSFCVFLLPLKHNFPLPSIILFRHHLNTKQPPHHILRHIIRKNVLLPLSEPLRHSPHHIPTSRLELNLRKLSDRSLRSRRPRRPQHIVVLQNLTNPHLCFKREDDPAVVVVEDGSATW